MTLTMVYFHEAPTLELELLAYIAMDSMINHSYRKIRKMRMHITKVFIITVVCFHAYRMTFLIATPTHL